MASRVIARRVGLSTRWAPSILPPRATRQKRWQTNNPFGRGPQFQRFGSSGSGPQWIWRWIQRPTFYYEIGGVGVLVGGIYISNLETVPVSGRRRFNIISERVDENLAEQIKRETLAEYRNRVLSPWDKRHLMVERVLERLIPASGLPNKSWEVHVIDDPSQKNAFVLPGGKVFVFSGILPICENQDGVATVLSHEIAHTVARHHAERMSQAYAITRPLYILGLSLGIDPGISRLLMDIGYSRPANRKQESEADYIGLLMMSESCFDPNEAIRFWQRMREAESFELTQFLSTHPSHRNRAQHMEQWLPEARDKFNGSECASTAGWVDEFRNRVSM